MCLGGIPDIRMIFRKYFDEYGFGIEVPGLQYSAAHRTPPNLQMSPGLIQMFFICDNGML
jgi:hypothetical protein